MTKDEGVDHRSQNPGILEPRALKCYGQPAELLRISGGGR